MDTSNAQEILPGPAEALTISVDCLEYDLYQAPLTKVLPSKISLIISNKHIHILESTSYDTETLSNFWQIKPTLN